MSTAFDNGDMSIAQGFCYSNAATSRPCYASLDSLSIVLEDTAHYVPYFLVLMQSLARNTEHIMSEDYTRGFRCYCRDPSVESFEEGIKKCLLRNPSSIPHMKREQFSLNAAESTAGSRESLMGCLISIVRGP